MEAHLTVQRRAVNPELATSGIQPVAEALHHIVVLLRPRSRDLFQRSDLRILATKEQWAEMEQGLGERAATLRPRASPSIVLNEAISAMSTRSVTRLLPPLS